MKKVKPKPKMYVARYYLMANSLSDARRQCMKREPDEINISEDWKNGQNPYLAEAIGYHFVEQTPEDEESSYT